MTISRNQLAEKILSYLQQTITLSELVDWTEDTFAEGEPEEAYFDQICEVTSRLGLADIVAFGLSLQDCEQMLNKLGYKANIKVQLQEVR